MEVRRKRKTLAGLFSKYAALFCINTLLLVVIMLGVVLGMTDLGLILPANYAETKLSENEAQIRKGAERLESLLPYGCTYGVYSSDGVWMDGSFLEEEREDAWKRYDKANPYHLYAAGNKGYYRFIEMDDGKICIVKYQLIMRYSIPQWNRLLPPPEIFMLILDFILFILNVVLLSGHFAKKLKAQLQELSVITDKIAANDLEFETKASDLQEINEVMTSLGRMKDALQDSLQKQWDMEKQKQEQLSALAHDIKTPLTIIRGNAELLEEGNLTEEDRECASYILANVKEIEQYLTTMRLVLHGKEREEDKKALSCSSMEEMLRETAKQLSAAEKIPVSFDIQPLPGKVFCYEENLLRAWNNIVSNAAEHTDREKGLDIFVRKEEREGKLYLVAAVRDHGTGFSEKDMQHAAEEFYSGDTSRHDRNHQGLGLSIAKRFMEEQGGFLEYKNRSEGNGAEVALWVKMV